MKTQVDVCREIERLEGGNTFVVDEWKKEGGTGGGITCVLQDGKVCKNICLIVQLYLCTKGSLSFLLHYRELIFCIFCGIRVFNYIVFS